MMKYLGSTFNILGISRPSLRLGVHEKAQLKYLRRSVEPSGTAVSNGHLSEQRLSISLRKGVAVYIEVNTLHTLQVAKGEAD